MGCNVSWVHIGIVKLLVLNLKGGGKGLHSSSITRYRLYFLKASMFMFMFCTVPRMSSMDLLSMTKLFFVT